MVVVDRMTDPLQDESWVTKAAGSQAGVVIEPIY
jgi:hypothetical protein